MNEWMDEWMDRSNVRTRASLDDDDFRGLATFGIVGDVGDDERVGEARRRRL